MCVIKHWKEINGWYVPGAQIDWSNDHNSLAPKNLGLGFAKSLAMLSRIRYKYDVKITIFECLNSTLECLDGGMFWGNSNIWGEFHCLDNKLKNFTKLWKFMKYFYSS